MTVLVIGNGESRRHLNLPLQKFNFVIGCNAIFRDIEVDHLICVDRRMVEEALQAKIKSKIYTRDRWLPFFKNEAILPVPSLPFPIKNRMDDPFNWGSGPYAILLGTVLSKEITLIGFDLYSDTNYINNIYKGTFNYDPITHHAIDPRYWIYQIYKIFDYFKCHKFKIVQSKDWTIPISWQLPNVTLDSTTQFC